MLYVHRYRRPTQIEHRAVIPVALAIAMSLVVLIAGAVVSHLATHGWSHQTDFPPREGSRTPPNWTD